MPIINYVREHVRFIEYAVDEQLSGGERLLWYALMDIMNRRAQGNVWPEEFIRISNDRLTLLTGMKFDAFSNARNGLKQRGLIEYIRGNKNKESPAYRMVYFYPSYVPSETERDGYTASYPEKTDKTRGYPEKTDKPPDKTPYKTPHKTLDKTANNTINHKSNDKENETREEGREEEEEGLLSIAREADGVYRQSAREAWKRAFGGEITPALLGSLCEAARRARVDGYVLARAVEMAAERNANDPGQYARTLLEDWSRYGVFCESLLDEYLEARDAAEGKYGVAQIPEGIRTLERMLADAQRVRRRRE